jgi:peptidoglycan/LPS O-acetylase OafA/YrhL
MRVANVGGGSLQEKLSSLTGLRFVAAITVVQSHMLGWMMKLPPNPLLNFASALSGFGMTLFFVLSGFVIHMNYSQSVSTPVGLWNFFVARFARLYPLYFVFLCFDLLMKVGFHQFPLQRLDALPFYLTLTHSWLYLPIDGNALVYQFGLVPQVSWSISTEWFFYFAFPFLCIGIALLRGDPRTLVVAIAALCFLALAAVTAINLHYGSIEAYGVSRYGAIAGSSQDGLYRWLAYFSPYVRILEFVLGCLTSALVRALTPPTEREQRFGYCLLLSAIVGVAALQWIMFGVRGTPWLLLELHMNFGFAPLAAVIIFCCARYDNPIIRALSAPRVVLAGEASYSIYLSHLIVINAFRYEAPNISDPLIAIASLLQMTVTMAAIIGLSLVLWSLIEMPARQAVRRWLTVADRATSKVPLQQHLANGSPGFDPQRAHQTKPVSYVA